MQHNGVNRNLVYLGCCILYFVIGMEYLVFGMVHFVFGMAYLVIITVEDECAISTQQRGMAYLVFGMVQGTSHS